MSISRLLIANRGEIACRIMATCRRLGIETVAVYSDADAGSRHVRQADRAVRLRGDTAAETYLDIARLIAAARSSGAEAVHPGYGFLSENAAFASAVVDAGLIWVGPPPSAIAAMGSKTEAKSAMRAIDVPVLPDSTVAAIDAIGYPLLLKASAGGGGRGMRVVRDADELDEALASARHEALSAFGDDAVFAERLVERGRHVEIQIVADRHGSTAALFERECSIQRRHQKIVEEAPSPVVDADLRRRLSDSAVAAAAAVGYVGVGTVEFLLEDDGSYWFLEMNTRLQVEHPVTELVSGLDLVELQLRIAEGEALPELPTAPVGHAIEVRLTAEDPAHGYRPSTGTVHEFHIPTDDAPGITARSASIVRVDTGIDGGDRISPFYDSLMAKIIVWAPSRPAALARLSDTLRRARVHGPATNLAQLRTILGHPDVVAGRLHTGFLDEHPCTERRPIDPTMLAATAVAIQAVNRHRARRLAALEAGWRNVPAVHRRLDVDGDGGNHIVTYRIAGRSPATGRSRFAIGIDGETSMVDISDLTVIDDPVASHRIEKCSVVTMTLEIDGQSAWYSVRVVGDRQTGGESTPLRAFVDGPDGSTTVEVRAPFTARHDHETTGSLRAPMPGAIRRVHVTVGDEVAEGQVLVSLEAMKMEHVVSAPTAGTVVEILVTAGQQVESGQYLLILGDPTP